jgi:hypothetical protein
VRGGSGATRARGPRGAGTTLIAAIIALVGVIGPASVAGANDTSSHEFLARPETSPAVHDASGSAIATLQGGAYWSSRHSGLDPSTASFVFVGGDSRLAVADPTVANFGRAPFTIIVYLQTRPQGSGGSQDVVTKRTACGYGDFIDLRVAADGAVTGELDGGATADDTRVTETDVSVTDGRWHQIIFQRGVGGLSITVDGFTASKPVAGNPSLDNGAGLSIGGGPCAASAANLRGLIDAVLVNPPANLARISGPPRAADRSVRAAAVAGLLVVLLGVALVAVLGRRMRSRRTRPDDASRPLSPGARSHLG